MASRFETEAKHNWFRTFCERSVLPPVITDIVCDYYFALSSFDSAVQSMNKPVACPFTILQLTNQFASLTLGWTKQQHIDEFRQLTQERFRLPLTQEHFKQLCDVLGSDE